MNQISTVAIDHQDTEIFVIDVALDQNGGVREDFVEIERRVDLLADFRECGEDLCRGFRSAGCGCLLSLRIESFHEHFYYSRRMQRLWGWILRQSDEDGLRSSAFA